MDTRPIDADRSLLRHLCSMSVTSRWSSGQTANIRIKSKLDYSNIKPFDWSVITRDSKEPHNHRKPDVTMHEIELLPMLHLSENWDKKEKMLPLANPLSSSYSYDLAMRHEYSFWFLLSHSVLFISLPILNTIRRAKLLLLQFVLDLSSFFITFPDPKRFSNHQDFP